MSGTFRERQAIRDNERERARAEREYNERRSEGVQERARQREAEAADRRARVRAEQAAAREAQTRARAQADVERFNRPPRIVPYEERLPAGLPRETQAGGGGGGGRLPPPGGPTLALPPPEGGTPAPRSNLPATTPRQIPLTTPRMPPAAGSLVGRMAGPVGAVGSVMRPSPTNVGEAEALRAEIERMGAEQRAQEADADSARATPGTGSRAEPPRRRTGGRAGGGGGEADRLNAISLALARGERPEGPEATNIARRMGIEGYKKGGLIGAKKPTAKKAAVKKAAAKRVVKKAVGGAIKAPKVPGRPVGRPATTVKPMGTKPMAKAAKPQKPVPMPAFKKGGKVTAKGRKR